MKKSIKDLIKKNLGVDQDLMKSGKWISLVSGIDLLCKPLTLNNKVFWKKMLKGKHSLSSLINLIESTDKQKKELSTVLLGTVIIAIRDSNDHKINEKFENSKDLYDMIKEYEFYFIGLLNRLSSNKEFALVEALEAKN